MTARGVLVRVRPLLVVAAVAGLSMVALLNGPATASEHAAADYVVLAGAPGLRWDDLSPTATPALWRLAGQGSVGALVVRSASGLTCPADGWLTLGAGNLAEWGLDEGLDDEAVDPCAAVTASVESPDGIGGRVFAQPLVVDHNRGLSWGAQPGALAESVRCTVAVGRGAALAAARPAGRVDRYASSLPPDPAPLLSECVLSIVDLGTVAGSGAERSSTLARVDAAAAVIMAGRPTRSLVIVAGLADTERPSRLHVAIADGPGFAGGWLTSPSTNRAGYVQLFDLAPTALTALREPAPTRLFAGAPMHRLDQRPGDLAAAVHGLADADRQAQARRDVGGRFLLGLVVIEILILCGAVPLLRRAREAGPRGPRPVSAPLRRMAEVALVATGLALPVTLATDLVPWWRGGSPGLLFGTVWLAGLALSTAAVLAAARRRRTLGTAAAAAALAFAVVTVAVAGVNVAGVNVVTVAVAGVGRLQPHGVAGYSATDGDRYTGLGTVGLGVFMAGLFLAAGCVAQHLTRRWRAVSVALFGCAGVVVVGSPYLGSDAAGAVALTAGVCVAVVMAPGGWLTATRLTAAAAAGLVLMTCFTALELSRPAAERGSLGQFLSSVGEGAASTAVQRTGAANVVAVATSPLTLLAVACAAFVLFVLVQPWGGLRRLFGLYPAFRAASAGLTVSALLGGLLNGAGLVVAGAAAATALPLVTLTALKALAHADERTVASANAPDAPTRAARHPKPEAAAAPRGVLP